MMTLRVEASTPNGHHSGPGARNAPSRICPDLGLHPNQSLGGPWCDVNHTGLFGLCRAYFTL